jgi:hypothetical protein
MFFFDASVGGMAGSLAGFEMSDCFRAAWDCFGLSQGVDLSGLAGSKTGEGGVGAGMRAAWQTNERARRGSWQRRRVVIVDRRWAMGGLPMMWGWCERRASC